MEALQFPSQHSDSQSNRFFSQSLPMIPMISNAIAPKETPIEIGSTIVYIIIAVNLNFIYLQTSGIE